MKIFEKYLIERRGAPQMKSAGTYKDKQEDIKNNIKIARGAKKDIQNCINSIQQLVKGKILDKVHLKNLRTIQKDLKSSWAAQGK